LFTLRFVIVHPSLLLFNAVLFGCDHSFQNILLQVYRSEYQLSSAGAANQVFGNKHAQHFLQDKEANLLLVTPEHSEGEGSGDSGTEILRCAQDDSQDTG
jgi:hypothetical protein